MGMTTLNVWVSAIGPGFGSAQGYPPGTELFLQGRPPEAVYLVEHGIVKFSRTVEQGNEVIVDLRFPSQVIGAGFSILGREYPVTATTVTRCELVRIQTSVFLERLQADPKLALALLEALSEDVYSRVIHVSEIACRPARLRLEQLLWQLVNATESTDSQPSVRLNLPLKYWEIAELLAVTPAYLSKLFQQMEQDGVVRRDKGWIVIPDLEKLWHAGGRHGGGQSPRFPISPS